MPDYTALANTAKRLVDDAGRLCTFVQYAQTPGDSSRPWRGPANPRASVEQSHSLIAVDVDVGTAQRLGIKVKSEDLLKRVSKFYIVAPGASFSGDLAEVHEVVDGSTRYSVLEVATLQPADVKLLHYVAVAR